MILHCKAESWHKTSFIYHVYFITPHTIPSSMICIWPCVVGGRPSFVQRPQLAQLEATRIGHIKITDHRHAPWPVVCCGRREPRCGGCCGRGDGVSRAGALPNRDIVDSDIPVRLEATLAPLTDDKNDVGGDGANVGFLVIPVIVWQGWNQ